MQLKTYEQDALDQLAHWLDALKEARSRREKAVNALEGTDIKVPDELRDYPLFAWKLLTNQNLLPAVQHQDGTTRRRLQAGWV